MTRRRRTASDPPEPEIMTNIELLDTLDCSLPPTSLTIDNFANAFPKLTEQQQHVDCWVSYNTLYGEDFMHTWTSWITLRQVTMSDLTKWKTAAESRDTKKPKTTGAKKAISFIKTLRELQSQLQGDKAILRALEIKEVDYLMLLRATKDTALLDRMIPTHTERLLNLLEGHVRTAPISTATVHAVPPLASAASPEEDMDATIASFIHVPDNYHVPNLVGHETIREVLNDMILLPKLYSHLIQPSKSFGIQGILLFGPPGTGKTLLAQNLAASHDVTFFKVEASKLTSKWMGETEKLMHTLFKVAKIRAPSIIFIDEIDYLTRMRQQGEDSYDRRVKNQLLELFNVLGKDTSILLIGATNRPWDLDSAFLSRFPQRLFFDLPLEDESVAIISESINGERHDLTSADLYALARSSKGYSGRDINAAIAKMRLQLFREVVHSEHFAPTQIEGVRISWEPCGPQHPKATQLEERNPADLVMRSITRDDIKRTIKNSRPSTRLEDVAQYRKWNMEHGTTV